MYLQCVYSSFVDTNVMVPPVIKQVKPTPSVVVPVENKPEKPQADPPVYNSPPKQPDASVSNSNQGKLFFMSRIYLQV